MCSYIIMHNVIYFMEVFMKDLVFAVLLIVILFALIFVGSFAVMETANKLHEVGLKNILEPIWNGAQNG